MAAKISIVADATFVAPVSIHRPGKDAVDIDFTFKHRTKPELDKFRKEMEVKKPGDVEYVMLLASGWELDEDWSKKNLATFFSNYHTAAIAITQVYFEELRGAKRKN